jgi:hypothetical protein
MIYPPCSKSAEKNCALRVARTGRFTWQDLRRRAIGSRGILLMLSIVFSRGALRGQAAVVPQLQFSSSDARLANAFGWARNQALAYAFSGDPVGLWYEAALPGREAFCMRDVSHQSTGAQALELAAYTYNMLRHFAADISPSRDWCSYWEIDRENRPAPVDYASDEAFWYNLPANFDVLDASYRMYLWTSDIRYINNPVFDNFYDRTMNDYVKRWTLAPDSIMNRQRWLLPLTSEEVLEQHGESHYRRGIPGYNESDHGYVAGIDLLAAEYAAWRDYAAINHMRGDDASSKNAANEAALIKSLVNTTWWNAADNSFYSMLDAHHHLKGRDAADVLYWGVADEGPKTEAAVKDLLVEVQHYSPCSVEEESHYAEILYRYGEPEAAYSVILDLARPGKCRQEYPEVSFSVVGAITTGVMGVSIVPGAEKVIETLPGLTAKTAWAELRNLPVGRNSVDIRHDGIHDSTFINLSGPALIWRAAFPGIHHQLLVKGRQVEAHIEEHSGTSVSWVQVPVGAGDSVNVRTPTPISAKEIRPRKHAAKSL